MICFKLVTLYETTVSQISLPLHSFVAYKIKNECEHLKIFIRYTTLYANDYTKKFKIPQYFLICLYKEILKGRADLFKCYRQ